jgi:hypothetical protein
MYESLLFFKRLSETKVDNYDFANGAPAVGATLDLQKAPRQYKKTYGNKPARKNLFAYFVRTKLPNIILPQRRYHTTNDPVMTTALLNYFFNQRTQVFEHLSDREKMLLHSIYDLPEHQAMLPKMKVPPKSGAELRQHQRYSLKCPGNFVIRADGKILPSSLRVVELSVFGFLAHSDNEIPTRVWGEATIQLGNAEQSTVQAMAVRGKSAGTRNFYGFMLAEPDEAWRKFVGALTSGVTHEDLENATRFMKD